MKQLMQLCVLVVFLLAGSQLFAQDALGKWKTIDDNTGEAKSIVEIYEKDGKYYGKVVELFRGPDEEQDPVCEECTGSRKGQKIIGMNIVTDMKFSKDVYSGGEIMDPENGKQYTCKFWLEDEKTLKVRGYIAFLYRTQTWHRAD